MKMKLFSGLAAAALLASPAMAAGHKAKAPKSEKACTAKGGTWNKKDKKCELTEVDTAKKKEEAAQPTTGEAAPAQTDTGLGN